MLESYVTPLITSYLSKYIKNIKPSDLQLSFWGGDVVLRNLELRPDTIEESLKGLVPFTLKSGCVKSLTIHIPWTAIGSEAITLSLDNVECSVKLRNLRMYKTASKQTPSTTKTTPTDMPDDRSQQAPGYVQGLMNRIVNNIIITVQNLIVSVIEEESDLLMSFTVKSLRWCSANDKWMPEYVSTDSYQGDYTLCKMCTVNSMTVCLDQIGSGGHVEMYEDPFVPRCSLECHWMSRYNDGKLVENKVDLLINDLVFSVTEVQFSLFLHLLDWLVAMYYSYKKLKGRDDNPEQDNNNSSDNDQVIENISTSNTTEETMKDMSHSLSPIPASSTDEQGWGSWLYSFVEDDSESVNVIKPVIQVSTPSLSLNLIAKHITVNLKITQKKRDPVFFTSVTKVPTQVIKIKFLGCLAHVSRIPSSTLLGVSVGIMSVNAWVGGLCPCKKTKKSSKTVNRGCFEDTQIHVYSLGSFGVNCDTSKIMENTFFQSTTIDNSNNNPIDVIEPKDWLQRKDYYKAVWFSYEYYDKGADRQESCDQTVILGEQSLILSPDVVHCVWFFIDHFLTSLEAVPMISKGMVVIGDPLSQTNLHILSNNITVRFPANHHIVAVTDSRHMLSGRMDITKTLILDSVILSIDSLKVNIDMPMYSGNDTPIAHQEFRLNVECCRLKVFSHTWSITGLSGLNNTGSIAGSNTGLTGPNTGLTGSSNIHLTGSNTGFSVPNLAFDFRKKAKGTNDSNESHCHSQITQGVLTLDYNELLAYCKICSSWLVDSATTLPFHSTLDPLSSKQLLSLQLYSCSFELDCQPIETKYTASLQDIRVSFSSPQSIMLPVIYCLKDASQLVQHNNPTLDVLNELTEHQTAVLIQVIQRQPTSRCNLSVQLNLCSIMILLEFELLSFVNTILNDLVTPLLKYHYSALVTPQEVIYSPGNRPDPEGVSSVDLYSSPNVVNSFDLPPLSSPVIIDEEEDPTTMVEEGLLSILNEMHLNIETDHVIIVSIVTQLDYSSLLNIPIQTPLHVIKTVVNTADVVFVVLPALNVHTTDSHVYPSFATKLPGASSWQASLTDGAIYVIENGGIPSYMLYPFNVEVSAAPVQSSLSLGGVSGYGVHMDSNLLHFSFSRSKVFLSTEALKSVFGCFHPFLSLRDSSTEPVAPITPLDTLSKHPASVLSSPRPSHSLYHPPAASDSSFSIISSSGSRPSLWLQCTLTKLVVDLSVYLKNNDIKTDSDERKDTEKNIFVYESEDISFSLDKKEKHLCCQLKICTLEGYQKSSSMSNDVTDKNKMFEKIFSSRSTILNEQVLEKIEVINEKTGSSSSSPVLNKDRSMISHRNFIVFDISSYSDSHKSIELKLLVQMFECVVCVPLIKAVVDIFDVILDYQTNDQRCKRDITTTRWPLFQLNVDSFRFLLPHLSLSSCLLADIGGITVKSDLSYPIGRLEVNASAFRKLNILAAEKRIPPLPGYEVEVFTLKLIGVNIDKSVSVYPVLVTRDIQIQYSPALQWQPVAATSSNREKVFATGNSVEICFKSDIEVVLGLSQIACVAKLARDFSSIISHPSNQEPFLHIESNSDTNIPFHILLTTKLLQITYLQGSLLAIELMVYDPIVMVTSLFNSLSVKLSVFSIDSLYYNETVINNYTPLLTTGPNPCDHDTSNCLSINIKQDKENCVSEIKLDKMMNFTISPELLTLLHTIFTDLLLTVTPLLSSSQLSPFTSPSQSSHLTLSTTTPVTNLYTIDDNPSVKHKSLLTNLKINFKTEQLILHLMGGVHHSHTDSISNSCIDSIIFCCNEVTVAIPPPAIESLSSTDCDAAVDNNRALLLDAYEGFSLSASVCCTAMQIKCFSHVISCTDHMTNNLLFPTNIKCDVSHYFDNESSNIKCAYTILSLFTDHIHLSGGVATMELLRSVLLSYIPPIENTTQLIKNHINDSRHGLEERKELIYEDKLYHDDLRQEGMTFNTTDINCRVFPKPGEVRFFEGNTRYLPHMIWQYKEAHCVTGVSILPVPLSANDMNIHCELAYFDEIDEVFISVGSLHLSETTTTTLEHIDTEPRTCSMVEEPRTLLDVHARIWCLTIIGFESSDEGEEDGTDVHIPQVSTGSVLSPLALAGCTIVDSIIHCQHLPSVIVAIHSKHILLSLLNQPKLCTRAQSYGGYLLCDDLSWQQLCFVEVAIDNLKVQWKMKTNKQQLTKVGGTVSMSVQDLRNLTYREVIHPTRIATNLKQAVDTISLEITLDPCLIRVSPTLIHTITMATSVLSRYRHQSDVDATNTATCTNDDIITQLPVFATHIICNNTTSCLSIGQESTIEQLSLPSGSCIGYHWNTHLCDQQRLKLGILIDCELVWSSCFTLDQEGIQQITITDKVLMYVEVIRQNGIRTEIVISGLWTIISHLSRPLFVCPVRKESQSMIMSDVVENSKNVSFIIDESVDCNMLRVATSVNTSQTRSYNWFDVFVKEQSSPTPIKISTDDTNTSYQYFWCNISYNKGPHQITFEPLFTIINNLPQNLLINFKLNDVTATTLTDTYSISGCGKHTQLYSLVHDTWYLVKLSNDRNTVSSPFPLSTCIINQIPVITTDDTIEYISSWPYNECTNKRIKSSDKSTNTSTRTLSLPIDDNGASILIHVDLHRHISSNTILVTLSPDVLVVNETDLKLQIITTSKRLINMDSEGTNVTALVNKNEEYQINLIMNESMTSLYSPKFTIVSTEETRRDKKRIIKKIKLRNGHDQVISELIMDSILHQSTVIVTMKPSHIVVNKTPHALFVLPCLQSMESSASFAEPFNDNALVLVNCSEGKPIPIWIMKYETETKRLVYYIKVSIQPTNEHMWSLPLLLNFVRHSFSLPVTINNLTPPTLINYLVTTHELNDITYIVISTDSSPRLIVKNLCPQILEIKEANVHWIHSHSQTVWPHSQVTYEPPTLAMQYPLIEEWENNSDESDVQQRMKFKKLPDIDIQIGCQSQTNHDIILWSSPFKLCDTVGIVVPQLNGTIDVLLTRTGRTAVMSIVPIVDNEQSITKPACIQSNSLENNSTFLMDILLRQLIVSLEIETPTVIQPALIITSDHTLINVHHTSCINKVNIVMDTIQIDNCIPSCLYQVVLCPRVVHDPPASLLKPNSVDPFINVSVEVMGETYYDTTFTDVCVSVQPMTIQLDDILILRLIEALTSFRPPTVLSVQDVSYCASSIPKEIIAEVNRDVLPISLKRLHINSLAVYLTAHMCQIISLSCDDSALHFSAILLTDVYTNTSDLTQSISLYYISGLLMQLGSVLGSLDLIGSPGLLIHRLQTGLYNFIHLPYEGITRGPGFFVLGVGQGVSSLFSNVSLGVLRAVTNFSTSIASNMEHLSLDPAHSSYQLSLRQNRETTGLGSSIFSGVSSFGMSLMSAVTGVVNQPMQMIHQSQSEDVVSYTQGLVAGMGKGLLGLVTKPVGGAFQLVSQTGQGLLKTSGLARTPNIKSSDLHGYCQPLLRKDLQASLDKYIRLLQKTKVIGTPNVIFCANGSISLLNSGSVYNCTVLFCNNIVHVFDRDTDAVLGCYNISQYECHNQTDYSTLNPSLSHIINQSQCRHDQQIQNTTAKHTLIHAGSIPIIEGDAVILKRHHKDKEFGGSYCSQTVEQYLTAVDRDTDCEPDFVNDLFLPEQYTLTFLNHSGKLFKSLFNHRKNIINGTE